MAIVLENALLVDLDPPRAEPGSLRIDGGHIVGRGANVGRQPGDEVVDCGGAVVMPGLVNGHTHLYSALAVGMPPPPTPPADFAEILKFIWWRLDQALDQEAIDLSARIGALDAVRCGTTTLIDHHASPNHIAGSLDDVERGVAAVGLRGVLCYETTDRHGVNGRHAGIEENRRFLDKCLRADLHRFTALVGAHACFTLEEETIEELAALAKSFGVGVHIHVAEDPYDDEQCGIQHQTYLIDWLSGHGLLRDGSVFAHGTHLDTEAAERVGHGGAGIVHCPRSNMNNSVGYAPVGAFHCPVLLGTDGLGSDMFAEARAAWLMSRLERVELSPRKVLGLLAATAQRAAAALDIPLGKLDVNAAADVVITDYRPATPLTADNLPGHFLFGLDARHVASVIVDGRWVLRDRVAKTCDEPALRRSAVKVAERLWARMAKIA